ncbi:MAG: hypothetical protein LBV69_08720 [Bacteroidales bacterium]|nr:hypothetical protein [Bacteroidales bacterium]
MFIAVDFMQEILAKRIHLKKLVGDLEKKKPATLFPTKPVAIMDVGIATE